METEKGDYIVNKIDNHVMGIRVRHGDDDEGDHALFHIWNT